MRTNLHVGRAILLIALGFSLVVIIARSFTIVGTGEIAVMTRFGKVTGQELGEGLHLKNPLDKSNKYDVKVQKVSAEASAASKDLQNVFTNLVINYRVLPGKVSSIHQSVGIYYQDKLIDPAVQETFKASTAKYDAEQLITERDSVKSTVRKALSERMTGYGIEVLDVNITNFRFSKEFAEAIESKQVAQQNAERAKFNLDASKTDAEAQKVQSETLSPLFLEKQAIEKWNGKLPEYLGEGTVFNIPLK